MGQTTCAYAERGGYDRLHQSLRSSSHAGGHWFESSSLHQIPPHLRWDFSFGRTPQTVDMTRFSSLHANNFVATLQQVGTNFRAAYLQVFSDLAAEDVALMWHLLLIQEPHKPCWLCPAGVSRAGNGCRRGASYLPLYAPRGTESL